MTATGTREGGLDDTVQVVTRVYQHPDEAQELMLKLSGTKAKTIANAKPKLSWRVHEDGDSVSVPAFAGQRIAHSCEGSPRPHMIKNWSHYSRTSRRSR